MREKRRPTLEELKELPEDAWRLEAIQTKCDALELGQWKITEEAQEVFDDPEITPEKVVAIREKLGQAAREAQMPQEECAKCGRAFPASFEGILCPDCVEIAAAV